MVVHNVDSSVEICLLSTDLYGQNKLLSTKYFFLPGARAPPKLNVASPLATHVCKECQVGCYSWFENRSEKAKGQETTTIKGLSEIS
jgi:hypothetical protein